jgi:TolB protein
LVLHPLRWPVAGLLLLAGRLAAAPFIAYIGNVPVHSPSPDAAIMVYDVDAGTTANAGEGLWSARSPAWSPDGNVLAFEAIEQGLNDIFVCAPDGSGRVNATQTPDVWESSPALLDTNRPVFLEGPDRTHLWLLDLTTGSKTKLTERPAFHGRPVVTPDGKLVAIVASEKLAGPGDILLVDVGSQEVRNLTQAPALYSPPAFSPDGKTLAFCFDGREIGGAKRGLAVMPVAGGEAKLLADDGYPLAPLDYSPDGTRIAYTSAEAYHNTWVTLINADGSGKHRLDVGSAHIIGWPSFSPDGKSLAFQAVYAARYTVRLIDLATGEVRFVTPEGKTGVNPVFSSR